MGNLAATYQYMGEYTEAEKLKVQVLDARNRILGVEHPDTIRAMASLAATHHDLGKYNVAEKLKIQVLDARNRILGGEHPDTIRAMGNLCKRLLQAQQGRVLPFAVDIVYGFLLTWLTSQYVHFLVLFDILHSYQVYSRGQSNPAYFCTRIV